MPNKDTVDVVAIYIQSAFCGDNVCILLRDVDDDDITPGYVLTCPLSPTHSVLQFEAQLAILDHNNTICPGYSAVMHCHTLSEEVTLTVSGHIRPRVLDV